MATSWASSPGNSTADWYRGFAEREVDGVSASYQAICFGVADDPLVCAWLDELPESKRQPNLLLGSVRFLGGPVSSWPAFREFLGDRWDDVSTVMRERRTQTNEPRRCATLLPLLASLPQPIALLEVGASAGLCLLLDRYSYRYEPPHPGPPLAELGSEAPVLRCEVRGPAPLPDRLPQVVWRAGLDLNPLDVQDAEDVRWLESLIWPEQTDRFRVLREAVSVAAADPPRIVQGDLVDDLGPLVDEAPADATLVVFHTAVLAYVDEPGRAAFAKAMEALAERRPSCWLSNEAPGVLAGTDHLPRRPSRFALARDGQPIALAGGHGDSLEWLS